MVSSPSCFSQLLISIRDMRMVLYNASTYCPLPYESLRSPVIAYNSMLLSGLLNRYLAAGNQKAVDLLRRISPAAWRHLHFLGHYVFRHRGFPINLEAILAGLDWEQSAAG